MDPPLAQSASSADEDEWDTDGFVIPSLEIEDTNKNKTDIPKVEDAKLIEVQAAKEEHIYLGPHGAPPSQVKQQEQKSSSRKQKFKQKLKEADRVYSGSGRENKVDSLRELVGGGEKMQGTASKNSTRDWLDPHCHESQFERRHVH
ncbi:hypothetical protein AAHA92_02503 [Salvia divinorum]|uniref:Uncharacterized protein n=1 Tax=Salvia divinorum TaxID=28513 RepID=A0ABD1IE42_SALDI